MTKPFVLGWSIAVLLAAGACGSDSGTSMGSGGGGGSGGNSGTTCANGYPKIDGPCAIENEKCTSCPTGYACCDIFACQSGIWALAQSKTACPDAGSDGAAESGPDAADSADGAIDAPAD